MGGGDDLHCRQLPFSPTKGFTQHIITLRGGGCCCRVSAPPPPQVKLCDFGLVTTRATTAGTPNYMAPELLGDAPFSKAVDVYAFGVVLWELFARKVPFMGWRPADIKEQV